MELVETLSIVGSYFIGSFPSAYIFGILKKKKDIRIIGTKNMGALNAFKSLGPVYGLATFCIDFLKGFLPLWIAQKLDFSTLALSLSTIAVISGHDWSIFLRFKGGKGGATSGGVMLALFPSLFRFLFYIFLVLSFISNNLSLGIGFSVLLLPILVANYMPYQDLFIPSLIIPLIGLIRLIPNIVLMLQKSNGNLKEMFYITIQGFFMFEKKKNTLKN